MICCDVIIVKLTCKFVSMFSDKNSETYKESGDVN